MSRIRLLVGTRKGGFIFTSDERRERWNIDGAHSPGWEMYHINASPIDPDRLYASQSSAWFGQVVQRSDDGGATWMPVGWYDGTKHPWEFARVWHFQPSMTDRETVYAGVEDAALFRSTDGGTGAAWQPGAGGMCLHTIVLDRANPQRILAAISAAGVFRSDDDGTTWRPINPGLHSEQFPIRARRSVTAFIGSRCTPHDRRRCTCRSTGM